MQFYTQLADLETFHRVHVCDGSLFSVCVFGLPVCTVKTAELRVLTFANGCS